MSELGDRMALIVATLAALYPLRVVTRDYLDPALRAAADLQKGVYTVLSQGEDGFTNAAGYLAKDARQDIVIVADIQLAENLAGSAVEDAEFTMIDEIKTFLRGLPATLCQLDLVSWVSSGQVMKPFGFVIFSLRYVP